MIKLSILRLFYELIIFRVLFSTSDPNSVPTAPVLAYDSVNL